MTHIIEPIGIIHTPLTTKEEAPIQGVLTPEIKGTVEVFPDYAEGLKDIEGFSHIILLYQFDRAGDVKLVRPTFLDDEPHGVFASRHPCRPSGIGMAIVTLICREKNILNVAGLDMLDATPLIDIKPYVPRFDSIPDAQEGWLPTKKQRLKPKGRE